MAYSLRLPDTLDASARAKADYLGISLNALVCVALDAYLRHPGDAPAARAEPSAQPEKPSPEPPQVAAPAKPRKSGWRERQRERDTAFR